MPCKGFIVEMKAGASIMISRKKIVLRILPYVAAVIFGGMFVAAMDVSSTLSSMQDSGFNLYHDQVDIIVNWFASKVCMILPPDGYVTNCVYVGSISAIMVLTGLLVLVLVVLMFLRKHENSISVGHSESLL